MRKTFKETDTSLPTKEELKALQSKMVSTNNRKATRGLFIETITEDVLELGNISPVFTYKDHNITKEVNGVETLLYSLKNIYFSYDHIPGFEYQFAKDVFNDWNHWVTITESSGMLGEQINSWREELTIKLQAKAFSSLYKTALFEGSKGTPAARFLADRGWEVKRGRPTTEEVTRERKIAAGVEKEVAEDIERLGLTLIKTK